MAGMSGAASVRPDRDFSDLAALRGSLVACLAAHIMGVLIMGVISAFMYPGVVTLEERLEAIPTALAQGFSPLPLLLSLLFFSCCVVVGLFWLAAEKRDHTTYGAAARAGAKAAGTLIAVIAFFMLFMALLSAPAGFGWMAGSLAVLTPSAVLTGAVAGLAGRLAAGRPEVAVRPD